MRKIVRFILASAMLAVGMYLLVTELLLATRLYAWAILAGAILVMLGAYLLPLGSDSEQ